MQGIKLLEDSSFQNKLDSFMLKNASLVGNVHLNTPL